MRLPPTDLTLDSSSHREPLRAERAPALPLLRLPAAAAEPAPRGETLTLSSSALLAARSATLGPASARLPELALIQTLLDELFSLGSATPAASRQDALLADLRAALAAALPGRNPTLAGALFTLSQAQTRLDGQTLLATLSGQLHTAEGERLPLQLSLRVLDDGPEPPPAARPESAPVPRSPPPLLRAANGSALEATLLALETDAEGQPRGLPQPGSASLALSLGLGLGLPLRADESNRWIFAAQFIHAGQGLWRRRERERRDSLRRRTEAGSAVAPLSALEAAQLEHEPAAPPEMAAGHGRDRAEPEAVRRGLLNLYA